ncbi:MAG: cupin domain-containing protein [Chloroflexota bacterium]
MKRYSFGHATSKNITAYSSVGVNLTHIVKSLEAVSVVCIRLGADGRIGRHRTVGNQLFLVVEGAGEVSGADGIFHPIEAGQAAFWERKEEHETRTQTGLVALVIEGDNLELGTQLNVL